MSQLYVFADEAGDLVFSRDKGATRYFTFTTVTMKDCAVSESLLALRRHLAREGALLLPNGFHATNDRQMVRNLVYEAIAGHQFTIDATILDKPKARPTVGRDEPYFYRLAWHLHFKHLAKSLSPLDEVLVVVATIGTSKKKTAAQQAIRDVVRQVGQGATFTTVCWPAATDPCLQVADYCGWAIQRKWEHGDSRSYELIKAKIRSEFDVFALSSKTYY